MTLAVKKISAREVQRQIRRGKAAHRKLQKKIAVIRACTDAKNVINEYLEALLEDNATYEQAINVFEGTKKLVSLNKSYKFSLPKMKKK